MGRHERRSSRRFPRHYTSGGADLLGTRVSAYLSILVRTDFPEYRCDSDDSIGSDSTSIAMLDGGAIVIERRVVGLFLFAALCLPPRTVFALVEPLPRGGEKIFTVYIVNATEIDLPVAEFESDPVVSQDAYILESLKTDVCEVQNGSLAEGLTVVLRAAPVAAHSTVNCPLRMKRSSWSDFPAVLVFRPSSILSAGVSLSDSDWAFGPLLDVSLRAEQIPPFPAVGERTGVVRITVHNQGPWYLDSVTFGYCQDFVLAPFTLDNGLTDGCEESGHGPICWQTGPSVEFSISAFSPGETKSCVLRATADKPLAGPIEFPIGLVDYFHLEGDEILQDYDHSDDETSLVIAPISGARPAIAAPISRNALVTLVALLSWLGASGARRAPRQPRM